jgi:hypothetical protein
LAGWSKSATGRPHGAHRSAQARVGERRVDRFLVAVDDVSTPAGSPASTRSSAKRIGTEGSRSDGLRMKALPQASAGANFHIGIMAGKPRAVGAARTGRCRGPDDPVKVRALLDRIPENQAAKTLIDNATPVCLLVPSNDGLSKLLTGCAGPRPDRTGPPRRMPPRAVE